MAIPNPESGLTGLELEERLTFDKGYDCPVCEMHFTARTVRTGKVHLKNRDQDMRPNYDPIDSLKYGTVVCPHCGYAALTQFHRTLMKREIDEIRNKISPSYSRPADTGVYTYETARKRAELCLVNAITRKAKNSERSYICLHIAWLIRGASNEIGTSSADVNQRLRNDAEEEQYIKNALEGFLMARQTEPLPMCGMDENTLDYLLAALLYRTRRYEEAAKLVMQVVTSRSVKKQLKDMADDLKEQIRSKVAEL